ncbi:MAG: phosphotransferase family protein [Pseudomonadota bacterium]
MPSSEQEKNTGVGETPSHLQLDGQKLSSFLQSQIDGFAGPLTIEKFKGGQSNPTYRLTTPERRYVLRRKPPGKLLASAHAVDREYRVMTALGKEGYPVPKTFLLCEDEDVIGSTFFVMDYVEGRIFWDAGLPDVSVEQRGEHYHALIDTLADLHKIDPTAAGLSDYGKTGNYFERQIARWSKQYKAAETETIEDIDKLIEWLPTAIPDNDETRIVHGDYRFDNLIMHPTEPKALAVLDWELSTLGHPLADFTYLLLVWFFPKSVRGGLMGRDLKAEGIPTLDEASERYCARTGRDGLPDLDFCLAYNMFRLTAIMQGVYARSLQGNASSSNAATMGAQVKPLANVAWSFAKKAGA